MGGYRQSTPEVERGRMYALDAKTGAIVRES
jgi:hypothetical protein